MVMNFCLDFLKFIYSEKATKFCEISTVDLTDTTQDKSTVEISQKFLAFSEYMNFNILISLVGYGDALGSYKNVIVRLYHKKMPFWYVPGT